MSRSRKAVVFGCNFNYSDYGWGWVSGAEREVPFRLRYLQRKAETNPGGILSRSRNWVLEFRDWPKRSQQEDELVLRHNLSVAQLSHLLQLRLGQSSTRRQAKVVLARVS